MAVDVAYSMYFFHKEMQQQYYDVLTSRNKILEVLLVVS